MKILNLVAPTLTDVMNITDPNGQMATVVELLKQTNEILEDMTFIEGNLPTGMVHVQRTGLPEAAWRILNYGVPQGKSTTTKVTDTCGMLEAYAEVDKMLVELSGNGKQYRLNEDMAFLQAMNIKMAEALFYGDTREGAPFVGLSPRYSTLSLKKAASAKNVIDGGGTASGALSSIWLVSWGANTLHGIFPKGSKGGWQHEDLGQVTLTDADGGHFEGYRTHYKWDIGLAVRDWRYAARLCNVDIKNIDNDTLIDKMVALVEAMPDEKNGNLVIYTNRETRTRLRTAMYKASNVRLTMDQAGGKKVISFDEIPVKRCDALKNTEALVTA